MYYPMHNICLVLIYSYNHLKNNHPEPSEDVKNAKQRFSSGSGAFNQPRQKFTLIVLVHTA